MVQWLYDVDLMEVKEDVYRACCLHGLGSIRSSAGILDGSAAGWSGLHQSDGAAISSVEIGLVLRRLRVVSSHYPLIL